jgi:hypothetical protein
MVRVLQVVSIKGNRGKSLNLFKVLRWNIYRETERTTDRRLSQPLYFRFHG